MAPAARIFSMSSGPYPMLCNISTVCSPASGVALPKEGSNGVDLQVSCDPKAKESVCAGQKGTPTKTVEDVQRAYAAGQSSGSS